MAMVKTIRTRIAQKLLALKPHILRGLGLLLSRAFSVVRVPKLPLKEAGGYGDRAESGIGADSDGDGWATASGASN